MKKIYFVFPVFSFLFLFALEAVAVENNLGVDAQAERIRLQEREEVREQIQQEIQQATQERPTPSLFQTVKERNQQMSRQLEQERERFQLQLANFPNSKKRETVRKIDSRIEAMNQDYTAKFAVALDKLQIILDQLKQKTEQLRQEGLAVATVETAINQAQTAIKNAREAVLTQTEKQYIIQLPAQETGLKNAVGATVSQFRQDLQTVRKAMVEAKQAVMQVVNEFAKISNNNQ